MPEPRTPVAAYPPLPAYGRGSRATPRPPLAPGAWTAIALSVVANLVTLVGVLHFGWPPGNVFLLFWLENAVLGVVTLVKVGSAQAPSASGIEINGRDAGRSPALYALFFTVHYGIFCAVHLVFTLVVAIRIGIEPTFLLLGLPLVLIVIRYSVETVATWVGPGGLRRTTSSQQAIWQPYPRVIVLHLAVLIGFGLVIGSLTRDQRLADLGRWLDPVLSRLPAAWQTEGIALVAVLALIKTVVDLATTVRVLRPRQPGAGTS